MPVPYLKELLDDEVRSKEPKRTPDENGISLKQLRELGDFLRRLCKAGVLKHTVDEPKTPTWRTNTAGVRIKWTQINMHDINKEVIKKLIPAGEHSCSWMEVVTRRKQKSRFFVSHNWAEPFRDFLHSIIMYAERFACSVHDVFFICTFANNQWKLSDDLGFELKESSFYKALTAARKVVLVMDKEAKMLERLWCIFEIVTALDQWKPPEISTPSGLIGDARISSGPVMEALRGVDITRAKASDEADMRQILNYLAGEKDQDRGLVQQEDGTKHLAEDAKALAPEGSRFTYRYEEELVRSHPDRFLQLNQKISDFANDTNRSDSPRLPQFLLSPLALPSSGGRTVSGASRAVSRATTCTNLVEPGCIVDEIPDRAMSLAQLREMCSKAKRGSWPQGWENVTCHDLINDFIRLEPGVMQEGRSYMEAIATGPQTTEWCVSCALVTKVVDLMHSLEWHAEARRLPDSARYWVISTSSWKEEVDEYIESNYWPPSVEAIQAAEGMVCVIDDDGTLLTRALCTLDVYKAIEGKKTLDFACPSGALATRRPFENGWEFGSFNPAIAEKASKYDIRKVKGLVMENGMDHAQLARCLVAGVEYSLGKQAPSDSMAEMLYNKFNSTLQACAYGPLLRDAALYGKLGKIKEVCSSIHNLDSRLLSGHSGETALHCVAAGGYNEAVEYLLQQRASINVQDIDGETPLHYAALAGQLDTVKLLIGEEIELSTKLSPRASGAGQRADCNIESYFGETASMVAEQEPARFLGVRSEEYAEVKEILVEQSEKLAMCAARHPLAFDSPSNG